MMFVTVILVTNIFGVIAKASGEKITGKTAMEISDMMDKGWNLGNSFDADGGNRSDVYSQEQSWGNPIITKELIDGVKEAGFNTIRIPITWYHHVDVNNNYKIDEDFLKRVNEVVDYAYDNDLFVIINVHHESWVNDKNIDKNYEKIGDELAAIWTQIADNFASYDQHLIFEGMNEPRAKGTSYEWTGTKACYDAINYLNQLFVTTIRENGKGYNDERALMIPGYAASSNPNVLKAIKIPEINGKQAQNVIISVHCYSPYNFCLSDNQTTFDPKKSSDTNDITSLITNLKTLFINKEVPVVIGECGAKNSKDNLDARIAWFTYMGEITRKNKIPAIVWDNGYIGNSGGECHNYFYRKTGEPYYEELINCFIYGNSDGKHVKDIVINFEPYKQGTETVLATPEQYGFEPKLMSKKAKINHTSDATVGYSAAVTVDGEKSYATMDISKFAGKNVFIQFFAQSKTLDSLNVGVIDSLDNNMFISADIDSEWTLISFSYKCKDDSSVQKLYFQGAGADDFYLDDISITMIDDDAYIAPSSSKEFVGDSAKATEDNDTTIENGKRINYVLIVIVVVIVIVMIISISMLGRKKNIK